MKIDKTVPTQTVSGVDISADTGTSSSDFITKTAAQIITGTLSANIASTDTLYGSVNNGSTWDNITSKVIGTGITWNGATLSGSSNILFKITDAAGNDSNTTGSQSYVLDTTAPKAPSVSGATPTNDTTPTWSWTSGGGGNGTYRYKLDDSDLSTGATQTTSTSYTSGSAISEGSHTLYVQERDAAGNWSSSGSRTIVIDLKAG